MKLIIKAKRVFNFYLLKDRWKGIRVLMRQDLVFLMTFFILIGCKNPEKKVDYTPVFGTDTAAKKTLIFGLPSAIFYEETIKLVNYLNHNLGDSVHIKCVAYKSFDAYLDQLRRNKFDFTFISGLEALKATQQGYSIVGKFDIDSSFYAVIIVNKDSAIMKPADLKGKTLSVLERSTLAGSQMPLLYLHKNGINVNKELKFIYTPSFESIILNVYLGKSSAGASWSVTWQKFVEQRPEILKKVAVKWKTPSLPNHAVIVNNKLDQKTKNKLLGLLLKMHQNSSGIIALKDIGITGFALANNNTYQPTKIFEKEYKSMIK